MTAPAPSPAAPTVPAIMTRPQLLAPGEAWRQRCMTVMHGTTRSGQWRSLTCGIVTQGGNAGLAAHKRVVHGEQ